MDLAKFGYRLQSLREEHGLLQKELADKIGIARATLASYETGRRAPEAATLTALASFFRVSVDDLLGREVPDTSPPAPKAKRLYDIVARADESLPDDDLDGIADDLEVLLELRRAKLEKLKRKRQDADTKKNPSPSTL